MEEKNKDSFEADIILMPNNTYSIKTKVIQKENYYVLKTKYSRELELMKNEIKNKLNENNMTGRKFNKFLAIQITLVKK